MGILSANIYDDEMYDLYIEVTAKISKQYPGRRILICWEIIFKDGWRKEESYDVSLGANEADWGTTTIDNLVENCIKSLKFSIDLYTVYYNKTLAKILIR